MKKTKNTAAKTELSKPEPLKIIAVKAEPSASSGVKIQALKAVGSESGAPKGISARARATRNGRVCFELVQPEAKSVCVAGSFNDWRPETAPLVLTGNGCWVGDLTLKPGRHEYLFVVDGHWIPDPNAKESVQNPFGGRNSILGVSE